MPKAPTSSSATTAPTTLERLKKNDPTLTKLKLVQPPRELYDNDDDDDAFDEFLEAMRRNTTVRYVLLERHFVRGLVNNEQWIAVLQAVGKMTRVEEVEIWSVRVPLQELCRAFQYASSLKRLGFGFVTLMGDLDATALCNHGSLENFYLSDFRLSDDDASLDSLCHALSTCPKLEYVEMFQYQQQDKPPFTPQGLATLLESASLHHLTLRRMGLTGELIADLANNLITNNSLRVLNFNENQLGTLGCTALGHALSLAECALQELDLRKNQLSSGGCFRLTQQLLTNKSLEKLNLACNPVGDVGAQGLALLLRVHPSLKTLELHRTQLTDIGCSNLVETLRHPNTCLVNLDLSFNQITELTYLRVADALKDNDKLKTINLQVNKKMKVQACEALLIMMKENTVLEQINTLLRVRFEPQEYHQVEDVLHQMNLYLRLNHAGRRTLLQGTATLQDWGNSLMAVQDDLNGLYYLLQANPTVLCDKFWQHKQQQHHPAAPPKAAAIPAVTPPSPPPPTAAVVV